MTRPLPVAAPHLWGAEQRYVADALEGGWISSSGPYLARFERAFAAYCGCKHGVAVANGTAALHLGVLAAGIGPGDEVILPDFTMISPALAVVHAGAQPVFVDAEAESWTMAPALVEAKVGPRTKAILAVHTYGHPCDMDAIQAIADRHGLLVIEDAAEAHGATVRGRRVGGLSRLACFSFYANKLVTTGEGGMVVTDDDVVAEHVRHHANLCFGRGMNRFVHEDVGFNYRLTNVQAAIGLAQVEHADEAVERKRRIARAYDALLEGLPGVQRHVEQRWASSVHWVYGIVLGPEYGASRDALAAYLAEREIETRPFFAGMHVQPVMRRYVGDGERFPISAELGARGLYLPSFLDLRDDDIERVAAAVRAARRGAGPRR